MKKSLDDKVVTLVVPAGWGPLTPPQQSTYIAAVILGNVFQSLVEYDMHGNLRPQLAVSWTVSPDLSIYTFTLDINRRFSNGQRVTSSIVKNAFEGALKVDAASANKSSLDVLYQLEEFELFAKTGVLSGIETPSEKTLIMKFKKPYRQALSFLTGSRYGIYISANNDQYYGTGPYQFETFSENEVRLKPNPYSSEKAPFSHARIIGVAEWEFEDAVCQKLADVYWIGRASRFRQCYDEDSLKMVFSSGAVTSHLVIEVNGNAGELFSSSKMRQAIQYLVMKKAKNVLHDYLDLKRVTFDDQFIMPLQPGRLNQQEVDLLIEKGSKWVPELIQQSKQKPIRFWIQDEKDLALVNRLKEEGLSIVSNEKPMPKSQAMKIFYKTQEYDLLVAHIGFGMKDPDDLYHFLGKYGAITSPSIGRNLVWDALEEGRSIPDLSVFDAPYQKLSRAILTEVPAIHISYTRTGFLYNAHNIELKSSSLNSIRFNLSFFKPTN